MFLHINIVLLLCVSTNLGYVNYQIIKNLNSFFENDGNGTTNETKPMQFNISSFNSDESDSYDEMVGDMNSTRVYSNITRSFNDIQNRPSSNEASQENNTFDNNVADWPWSSSVEQLAPAIPSKKANRTEKAAQIAKANDTRSFDEIINAIEMVNTTRIATNTENANKTISVVKITPKPQWLDKKESTLTSKLSKPMMSDAFRDTNNSSSVSKNVRRSLPIQKSWRHKNYMLLPSSFLLSSQNPKSLGFDPKSTDLSKAHPKDHASTQSNSTVSTTPRSWPKEVKYTITECPQSEEPFTIGPYEIPTYKELALMSKRAVLTGVHFTLEKALQFMREINEIMKLSIILEGQCRMPYQKTFKNCAKKLFNRHKKTNKVIITILEEYVEKLEALTPESVCETSAWPADPKILMKWIATENSNMQFALPHLLKEWQYCFFSCEFDE